ncbi:DUF5709 domain-containing protein [Micromonospora arborensis]|uniref:DUF5709 domain-containing protein n=1 Tax=Micromonospora arborensis TaxID=2116518 RepID=UPI003414D375
MPEVRSSQRAGHRHHSPRTTGQRRTGSAPRRPRNGRATGIDAGAASAEEAAVHVVEDPDGSGDGPLR